MQAISAPGIFWGNYPERQEPRPNPPWRLSRNHYQGQVSASRAHLEKLQKLSDACFAAHVLDLRQRLGKLGLTHELIAEGLATAAEAVKRSLKHNIYDTQLFAASVILDNRLAEMATGEGKTLSAMLAAATAALAGIPVHVFTTNDYLVSRDAEKLAPCYARLGLSVGKVTHEMDDAARAQAYASAVTYVTAKELVFDYLKDNLSQGGRHSDLTRRALALAGGRPTPILRGLCMGIIDEADSLLIDEAQMPLILSQASDDSAHHAFLWQAWMLAKHLEPGVDFSRPGDREAVTLNATGCLRLAELSHGLGGRWRSRRMREDIVSLALSAQYSYRLDRDYLIADGKVVIIDETTGRTAAGRVWSRGLHALIEIKEGCKLSQSTQPLAQITYQRFFPRYLRLGGMSGTLSEARSELKEIYVLPVVTVPLRTPCARKQLPCKLFLDRHRLWSAVAARVQDLHRQGRPVLIGTASVSESEQLARYLDAASVPHQILNARFEREEADLIAQAGMPGQVTIATNMAGRGSDIPLGAGVGANGGLHVLCCQHNQSRRIDRQLQGRCARQGEPGSTETWLSIDSETGFIAWLLRKASGKKNPGEIDLPASLISLGLRWQQMQRANEQRRIRRALWQTEKEWETGLAFRGRME